MEGEKSISEGAKHVMNCSICRDVKYYCLQFVNRAAGRKIIGLKFDGY